LSGRIRWRSIAEERRPEFVARGFRASRFFPHRVLFLPKSGPDGYKLAWRMGGFRTPSTMWEIVLYADPATLDEFPADLFFDDDLVWHQQQFGIPGQLATASAVVDGSTVWSFVHIADLVQRIGRRREHKTRIETLFGGWHDMLLNALLAFAVDRGAKDLRLATAELALEHTDPRRTVGPELFDRVYDRDVVRLYDARRDGRWWSLDLGGNRDRVVEHTIEDTPHELPKIVCVCHDVEADLGHVGVDAALSEVARGAWRSRVQEMLAVEETVGVPATYNVVGALLDEVRGPIERAGHCLAFHSYDHGDGRQLDRCRRVDYRLKGYRPPRSLLTRELSDENLLFHNFEWLANSARSLGKTAPQLANGLVRIPIDFDDFSLYTGKRDYDTWEAAALEAIEQRSLVVFSLHDCYGHLWLERYAGFLERVQELARPLTLDELAAAVTLAATV
jgi:hypothetical protein